MNKKQLKQQEKRRKATLANHHDQNKAHVDTAPRPIVVNVTTPPPPLPPERKLSWREWAPPLATVLLTAALVWTGYKQWQAIDGQLNAMIDSDRPWVGPLQYSSDPIDAPKGGKAKIVMVNTGKSPAKVLSFRAAMTFGGNTFPSDPSYDANSQGWTDVSQNIVLPQMPLTNEFPFRAFDAAQIQFATEQKAKIYLYGIVEYEDPRVKGSHYTTKVCAFWTANKLSMQFGSCPNYNEAN